MLTRQSVFVTFVGRHCTYSYGIVKFIFWMLYGKWQIIVGRRIKAALHAASVDEICDSNKHYAICRSSDRCEPGSQPPLTNINEHLKKSRGTVQYPDLPFVMKPMPLFVSRRPRNVQCTSISYECTHKSCTSYRF